MINKLPLGCLFWQHALCPKESGFPYQSHHLMWVTFLQQKITVTKRPSTVSPEAGLKVSWLHCSVCTLLFLFTVTVYVTSNSSDVALKPFFILIQNSCPHLQPAPRARLLSLCTVTLESFRVSLSMALRRPGYSDWSIGYMPEGQKNKREQCCCIFSFICKALTALTEPASETQHALKGFHV